MHQEERMKTMAEQTVGFEVGPWTAYFTSCMCEWYEKEEFSDWDLESLCVELSKRPQLANTLILALCKSTESNVVVPSQIEGHPIIGIARDAFRWMHDPACPEGYVKEYGEYTPLPNPKIKNIVLPPTVERIHKGAFATLNNLESINLPQCLNYLGERCFSKTKIKKIEIPKGVKEIPMEAFEECSSLAEIDLGNVQVISEAAFDSCSSLKTVAFPSSLKESWGSAFSDSGLEFASFTNGPSKIDLDILGYCDTLKVCCLPRSVTHIEMLAANNIAKNVTFFAPSNSYAYTWATQNGYKVVPVDM